MTGATSAAIRRPDLQQIVQEYLQDEQSMTGNIANIVMPVIEVGEKSSTYDVMPKEAMLKIQDTKRAASGAYNRKKWQYETGYYTTQEYGWEEQLEDSQREDFDKRNGAGMGEQITVDLAMEILMKDREKRVADMIFNATNFTANALTNEWDDATNATPIDDLKTAKVSIRNASGIMPNALIVNYNVFENLKRTDQIVNLLTYNFGSEVNLSQLSAAQLASVLGVEKIIVAGGMYDSAAGGQDATITELWSDEYAMLTRIESGIDVRKPSIGRTFLWEADSPGLPVTEQYREEQTRSDIYRVRFYAQENFIRSLNTSGTVISNISQAVSYLFSNVTT